MASNILLNNWRLTQGIELHYASGPYLREDTGILDDQLCSRAPLLGCYTIIFLTTFSSESFGTKYSRMDQVKFMEDSL